MFSSFLSYNNKISQHFELVGRKIIWLERQSWNTKWYHILLVNSRLRKQSWLVKAKVVSGNYCLVCYKSIIMPVGYCGCSRSSCEGSQTWQKMESVDLPQWKTKHLSAWKDSHSCTTRRSQTSTYAYTSSTNTHIHTHCSPKPFGNFVEYKEQ